MLDKKEAAIRELAPKIWKLSRDRLLVNLRFLDGAAGTERPSLL